MKRLFLLITILSISFSIYAQSIQSIDWGSYEDMPEETSYQQAIGFDDDASYFIRSDHKIGLNRDKVWLESVSSMTNSLETSNEILLPTVSGIQTKYETMFYGENKFVLFTAASNGNQNILYVSYLKPDGTLKNKPKEVAKIPASNLPQDGFNIFLSDDKKNIIIESHKTIKKYNSDKINLVVLDFNLVEQFNSDIVLADKYNDKAFIITQKSFKDGKFVFLAKSEQPSSRRSSTTIEYNFVVFVYNTAKKSIHDFVVSIQKYKVDDAKYVFNKEGNIVVGGFVKGRSVKFTNEKQGMFFKRYNPKTLKAIPDVDLKSAVMKFPREFITEMGKEEYGESMSIRFAYGVNSIEALDNGGYVVLAEQKWVDGRVVEKAGGGDETGIQYYHYNNIIAGGVDKKGKFSWIQLYPKAQKTTNDHGYYSSYKVIRIKNKLKLFYNCHEKNLHKGNLKSVKEFVNNIRTAPKGMAGVLTIYWDGSYERDPMFTGDNKVVFIPHTFAPNSLEYGVGVTNGKAVKFGSFTVE